MIYTIQLINCEREKIFCALSLLFSLPREMKRMCGSDDHNSIEDCWIIPRNTIFMNVKCDD